jgi:hypothetical protein
MRCNLKTPFSRAGRIWPSIYVVTLLIAFCASRLVYAYCGVEFRIKPSLYWAMHVLDVRQLRDSLPEAIWYLHAQPPLYNALIGAVLRAPENAQQTIFTVLYSAVALTGILCFHQVAIEISGKKLLLSWCLSLLLIISPATILFERQLIYEGLVPWLLVIGFYLLWRFLTRDQFRAGVVAYLIFASVVLIRSAFHPIWLAAMVAVVLAAQPWRWRRILAASVLGLSLVGAVMLKNQIVFGEAGLSSWMPNSLFQQMGDPVPLEQRKALVRTGVLSPYAALYSFAGPDELRRIYGSVPITGIPVLDDEFKADRLSGFQADRRRGNFNNIIYVITGQQRLSDALYLLVHFPSYYIDQTVRAILVYLRPSSEWFQMVSEHIVYHDHEKFSENLILIAQWDRICSLVFDGQPAALFGSTQDRTRPNRSLIQVGYFTLIEIMVVLVGTMALARTVIRHRQTDPATAGWLLAVGTTVLFITVIANLFDTGETNRARFMVEPLIYLTVVGIAVRFPGFSR